MLELNDVQAGYGLTLVLRRFNLHVEDAEIIAVLGRNGAGKSTLLRTIMGAIRLTSGSIVFDGKDLGSLSTYQRARSGIAYVPQGRHIFPGLTVLDNLRVAAYGTKQRHWAEQLSAVLEDFPVLAEKRAALGRSLSGGQQQILALGRALMMSPRLLLLDEPSEGIQPSIVHQIADALGLVHQRRGVSVIVVEQNLDFVASVATRAYIVEKGEAVGDFPIAEIVHNVDLQREYMGV
jgi:urea ABC transporter ATP-binding protein UrtE